MRSHGIHLKALYLDDVKIPISKKRLKIAVLRWHPGLPGANELTNQELSKHDWWWINMHRAAISGNISSAILKYSISSKLLVVPPDRLAPFYAKIVKHNGVKPNCYQIYWWHIPHDPLIIDSCYCIFSGLSDELRYFDQHLHKHCDTIFFKIPSV